MANIKNSLLTTKEAAQFLRISASTLYRIEKMGLLTSYRTPGGQRRFSIEDLQNYLETSKKFRRAKPNRRRNP